MTRCPPPSFVVPVSRRRLLAVVLSLGGLGLISAAWGRVTTGCFLTPRQTEGPFYPPRKQLDAMLDTDNDLTKVGEWPGRARGQIIYVVGEVRDARCRPVEGALVEIWQASENGRYHHPRDEGNPAPLDPHFQYWGKYATKEDGRYLFKTIKPGAYEAAPGWTRPPHIHFKVTHTHLHELITQMYFAGDPYQGKDFILNKVPEAERERVIVPVDRPPSGSGYEPDARLCRFDLTLHG